MVKKALKRLYTDTATIITYENGTPDAYGKIRQRAVTHEAVPCRVSFKSVTSASIDGIPQVSQSITLFLASDIELPVGSSVDVMRQGQLLRYKTAGYSSVYESHQEVALERREERG